MTADPSSTACRQAAALLIHQLRRDPEGVYAVIDEITDRRQMTALLLAMLGMFENLIPPILTPTAIVEITQIVADLAGMEQT